MTAIAIFAISRPNLCESRAVLGPLRAEDRPAQLAMSAGGVDQAPLNFPKNIHFCGLCGSAEDFFEGGQAGFDFVHAVGAESFVPLGAGEVADLGNGGALGDALFHSIVGDQ